MEEEEKIVWVNEGLKIVSFHYESDYERREFSSKEEYREWIHITGEQGYRWK
ncbi:MAG: hypothetical protein PHC41_07940 [Lachnospiraceae bacterium]|nr:hypothetical protein [Lachnospiraceae bacterium]MDD3616145.1 hypothetical protein [Lachnospiraceae bacterium]